MCALTIAYETSDCRSTKTVKKTEHINKKEANKRLQILRHVHYSLFLEFLKFLNEITDIKCLKVKIS